MEPTPASAYPSEMSKALLAEPHEPREGTVGFAGMQLEQAVSRLDEQFAALRMELAPVLGEGGEDVLNTAMPAMRDPAPLAVGLTDQVQRIHSLADQVTMVRERLRVS